MANFHVLPGFCVLLQLLTTCLSQAVSNTCTECARRPTLCRRISGLFTVTVLSEGTYNPVVEIPAPACSLNITEFSSSSNYIAIKTASGQGIINSYWGLGQPGQYYGAGVRFSYDRQSGSCKGTCIYSEGPTNEAIVVQILYYEKNPGIAYEFILPNSVAFTPFDGTLSKQKSATNSSSSSSSSSTSSSSLLSSSSTSTDSSSSSQPRIRYQQHRGQTHRRRHRKTQSDHDSSNGRDSAEFAGEYYTGSQYSRSEGRPEVTSAQEAYPSSQDSHSQASSHDYTNARYGSHTLGGRGLSYTYAGDTHSQSSVGSGDNRRNYRDRNTGRHVVDRYRSRTPHIVRKVASPQYVSQTNQRNSPYGRRSQYQSFSASLSYLDEDNAIEQFDGSNYVKTFNNRRTSLGQGQSVGSNQYEWKISGLTECSKTCGGGVQRTNIVCVSVSSRRQVVVTSENCANNLKPRAQTVECNTSPCEPGWEAEKWSECSVTCGSGTQTRVVECRQRFSSTLTLKRSADECGQDSKPAVAQQCEKGLCSGWQTGLWSECSKECGGGRRERTVRCVDRYNSQIPSEYCTDEEPQDTEPCNTQSCNTQWWMSDWSTECSESCGQGYRSRTAVCVDDRGAVTSEGLCDKRYLPEMQQACRSDAGCRGTWFAGPWDKCTGSCSEGKRTRQVVCLQRTVSYLSIGRDEDCDPTLKPDTEESCVNTHCDALWYTSEWSECSVTCGEGYRTRDVRCIENNRSPSQRCVRALKPETREVCSLTECTSRYRYQATSRSDQGSRSISSIDVDTSESTQDFYTKEERDEFDEEGDNVEDVQSSDENERETSYSSHGSREEGSSSVADPSCGDNYWNCLMVTQARLCTYEYYRDLCCHSCRKAGYV